MLSKKDKSAVLRTAEELRRKFRSKGEFRQDDFKAALLPELEGYGELSLSGLVEWAAQAIDERSARDRKPQEGWLLPLFDQGGEYRLGDGRRIAKSLANLQHCNEALVLDDANLAHVEAANRRKHEELERLRPYFVKHTTTKRQAVAAWRKANPQQKEAS